MQVLGISAFHRDSAAALVVNGELVAAAREERFTRKHRDSAFPRRAIRSCLEAAGIGSRDLDRVVFYERPLRKFERVLVTQLRAFPRSAPSFARSMFVWLGDRLWMKNRIASELGVAGDRITFVEHQRAHAASAFLASPFEEAAILTVDDAGEWATSSLGRGRGAEVELLAEIHFPHSLGLLWSALTQFLGLEPGRDEHQLEALAVLGTPRFEGQLAELARARPDGSFAIDTGPFRFAFDSARLAGDGLEELFGPARRPGAPWRIDAADRRDADLAASLQRVVEARVLELCAELHRRVPVPALCFAGALARNRTLNARLLEDGPFRALFVPPDPDEAGAAVGAALDAARTRGGGTFLGEAIRDDAEEGAVALDGDPVLELAQRLSAGESVGWVRGRMELGAHSLGHRSILAAPLDAEARDRLLRAMRRDEPFRFCRVAVPAELAARYFEVPPGAEHALRGAWLRVRTKEAARAALPCGIGVDGRAWVQLIDEEDADFHRLLGEITATGSAPLLLHASLRARGSPLVRNEADAVEAFRRSTLDSLLVEDRIYTRAAAGAAHPSSPAAVDQR